MQQKIKIELDRLVSKEILIPVKSSEWATPIVPSLKKDGTVRICGDYSVTVNKNLLVDEYPLPKLEELFSCYDRMSGMTVFSKIDLKHAYLQLQVCEEQQSLLTLATHCGLYKPTRLMFGIASAPAIWQRTIEEILRDIDGLKIFLDDIRIASRTKEEHIKKLDLIFKRLHDYNIQINLEKCEFFKNRIHFCGYIVDKNGINKDPEKYAAIENMPKPKNKSEVRAFLGFVTYYARFIKNLAAILHPLHNLLKDNVPFNWNRQCEDAFTQAKRAFCENKILAHYDPQLPLILAVDACSYGVGAVLSHAYPDGSERIIQCASQKLNDTQQKYANIDKEAYAIIFGIKKFHQYLFGAKFTLITDNQALTRIFSPDKNLPTFAALRMQHYALFLRAYNYEIRYKNSAKNANADGLSRLPLEIGNNYTHDVADIFYLESMELLPITAKEIAECTKTDTELQKIYKEITKQGNRSKKQNANVEEFSICNDVILRNDKVVVPEKLRGKILRELHWGHFGIVKMKSLARKLVWWPSINKDIENLVRNCTSCNLHRNNPAKVNTHVWEEAENVFDRVHIDFAGPFLGKTFLILVDAYSKFPIVRIVNTMSSENTILVCREIFSEFGMPKVIVTDNGRTFTSSEFKYFMREINCTIKYTAPYYPATNGQAENMVKTVKNGLKKLCEENKSIHENLCKLLLQYRISVHSQTGKVPAELFFGRKVNSHLDFIHPMYKQIAAHVKHDECKKFFRVGERVSVRDYVGKNKWLLGKVESKLGILHYKIKLDNGNTVRRHVNQMLKIGENIPAIDTDRVQYYPPPPVIDTQKPLR
nr:PREDICTED: uncharacterized protein K02A2.6-like [Megachile rotundata]